MMTLEEYTDLTIKLIIAFLVPLGWAAILYPLIRKFKKAWPFLLIIATLFSFGLLIIKEMMDQAIPIGDEIIAYLLGIFFGLAVLSLLFSFKNRRFFALSKINTDTTPSKDTASPVLPEIIRKDEIPLKNSKNIHLRHILEAGILMEERGRDFYNEFAKKVADPKTKDLCRSLAWDELGHKAFIEKILYRWLPLPPDREALSSIGEQMKWLNIYLNPPDINSTEEETAKYAIEQEKKMAYFYLSFEKSFPDTWKRTNIQILVMAERSHANKLISVYPHR